MPSSRLLPLLAGLLVLQGADRLPAVRPAADATPSPGPVAACPDCDVVLVSIDTLRPDHLGCYGYDRPTSPAVDAFCRDAVVFENALAHAPSTLPSHASMFTSWVPPHHGAKASGRKPLPDEALTLAEVLHAAGWRTVGFTDGGQVAPKWNLGQGFEVYESQRAAAYLMNRFAERVQTAIDWVESAAPSRYFLFLHTYEVHHPYTPHDNTLRLLAREPLESVEHPVQIERLGRLNQGKDELTPDVLHDIVLNYDAEIRSMDAGFGRLLDWLRESGRYDRTLLVFTSDHGEEFGEHGQVGWHSHTLYDELLRVPLVVRFPDGTGAGTRLAATARGIDLMPTILDALAVSIPGSLEGTSLLPLVEMGSSAGDAPLVAERDRWQEGHPKALRTRRWKLYRDRLYDLLVDPGETEDVAGRHPGVTRALATRLTRLLEATPSMDAEAIELDEELREQLRSLGYIQ